MQPPDFMKAALLFVFFLFSSIHDLAAQIHMAPSQRVTRVAIFAPLYLDSAFLSGQLKSQKSLPKLIMPGVEFVQGAEIAFDTLSLNGRKAEVYIYDSKSVAQPVAWLLRNRKLDSIDLILGSVKEPEYSQLAGFAVQRGIPFISVTYPNDGGIKGNPFTVIMNSTLRAHCKGIFNYIVQRHGTDNIYLVKKKNDDRIDNYFKESNLVDGRPLLKIKTIMLDSSISSYGLRYLVDTTRPIVIIGASLDEIFASKLAEACYPLHATNPLVLIGMPNWDGFRSLYQKEVFPDFPIQYTTPHYDEKENAFSSFLTARYFQLYRAKPGDMAAKGFEAAYYFTTLLLNYGKNFMQHLNENRSAVFHSFNFRPVYLSKAGPVPDYYENKHLFMMQILNGEIIRE